MTSRDHAPPRKLGGSRAASAILLLYVKIQQTVTVFGVPFGAFRGWPRRRHTQLVRSNTGLLEYYYVNVIEPATVVVVVL